METSQKRTDWVAIGLVATFVAYVVGFIFAFAKWPIAMIMVVVASIAWMAYELRHAEIANEDVGWD